MAVLASIGTGNFTTAGTWGTVDATSYLNAENATESLLTTAYSGTRSSAFTPGAITISHIGVKLCERIGTTGTISVSLRNSTIGLDDFVTGTEVTIDTADLPSVTETNKAGGWILFKLATPVLLLAANDYNIQAKTSSATMVDLWCDGTADNLSRVLVTTTTAAPGAGDDLIVAGEKTGAGTGNAFVVTMDNTATTDFGSAPTAANSLITPGVAICSGGTLQYGTTAATAYYLKVSNSVVVYAGGTLNIGTTGTPIPRDSSAVLEFDGAADGDYGLNVRHLATFVSQGLSRTSGKNVIACKLNTDEAANSTSLGVDTDTGWLDNDVIGVASTTRTATQTEKGTLNGNANAADMTVDGFAGTGGGILNAHSGTSPTQAEVVLLTRNVQIRSATSTIMAYVAIAPFASDAPTVDIDWTEFYYLGEVATSKQGIVVSYSGGAFSGSFDMQYSSIHDCEDYGFQVQAQSGNGITVSNNVFYNLDTAAGSSTQSILIGPTTSVHTFSGNYFLACSCVSNGSVISLLDVGLTFTNNTIAGSGNGASSKGIEITEGAQMGTISGNTIHSMAGVGFQTGSNSQYGTVSTMTIWRCTGTGLNLNAGVYGMIYDTLTIFGNGSENITMSGGGANYLLKSVTDNSDASFTVATGMFFSGNGIVHIKDSSFGATTTHGTADVRTQNNGAIRVYTFNTTFGSSTEASIQTGGNNTQTLFAMHKKDASGTTYDNYYSWGRIASDTTTRHTASGYSWKMTPNNATQKLIMPGPTTFDTFKVAVNASALVTIQAYVYKDATYNGNAPRLVLVGGIIGGIASDVTDSLTVAHSNWELLEVTGTPNEAGTVEFYVDADGTAGSVYVDDFTIQQA